MPGFFIQKKADAKVRKTFTLALVVQRETEGSCLITGQAEVPLRFWC